MARTALYFVLLAALSFCTGDQDGRDEGKKDTVTPIPGVNQSGRSCPVQLKPATASSQYQGVQPVVEKYQTALLLLLGFGGFSLVLAVLHNAIRGHVFHDQRNLDSAFDAGGNVSLSLTAVTVTCQLLWPVDILHSTTFTVRNGIAGPFWYSIGVVICIFIFPVFSVQFKTKAPGAKTYLQIIRARYGSRAHAVMCFLAILTNIVIVVNILLAGRATVQSLTKDASDEFCLLIMVTLFGSYSLVGGLGTTFYVSYFNACLLFVLLIIFMVRFLHNDDAQWGEIGNMARMHEAISCLQGPENNVGHSYLTFRSWRAFLYGVLGVLLASSVTYCDQASWQSRLAAKPVQGVWGFLLAGLLWFSIPNLMALTTGMSYLTLSSHHNATHLLTASQIDQGLVTPLMAQKAMGWTGSMMMLTMGAMTLMSTGSGEVMALSSILVYDIYQPYIRPFRKGLKSEQCMLCGKTKKELARNKPADGADDVCRCAPVYRCQACSHDLSTSNAQTDFSQRKPFSCPIHGAFRHYMDMLLNLKNWCIVMVTLAILPLGMAVFDSGISLAWLFYQGVILTIPSLPPVLSSLMWAKTTSTGVTVGCLSGLTGGVTANLVTAATLYEGERSNLLTKMAQDFSIMAGTLSALGLSVVGCVLGSLLTHRVRTEEDAEREWMKMYCIDNPLHPWETNFREELKGFDYEGRPSMTQMKAAFRQATLTAYIGGACCIGVFAVILPAILSSIPVMDYTYFSAWMVFNQSWAVLTALVVVLAPPAQEIVRIVRQSRRNRDLKTYVTEDHDVTELMVKRVDQAVDGEVASM